MTGLSRVLCAVDIDDPVGSTFGQALALARARRARLLLVCAVPAGEPFNRRGPERVAYLRKIRRRAEAAGVDVDADVQAGETADIILLHANSRGADLVVVGVEHDRSNGRPWASVAEDVLRSAFCSTLVVPAGARMRSSFTKVLCAVDSPSDAGLSVAEALHLSNPRERTITVLHVMNNRAASASSALQRLQAAIAQYASTSTVAHVSVGAVASEVLKATRSHDADLLVIGARPRSRVGRRLFGVTRELLTGSACSVLAVPLTPSNRIDRPAA